MSQQLPPNDARLSFRLPAAWKRTIEEAATFLGQSVSNFAVSTLAQTACSILEQKKFTRLSNRDRDIFVAMLDDHDARPNRALVVAAQDYNKHRG
jgi:uncharacterized protein (DUF1778 family)